ncbi:unnamed protein product [Hapterophycus canaliculatus]
MGSRNSTHSGVLRVTGCRTGCPAASGRRGAELWAPWRSLRLSWWASGRIALWRMLRDMPKKRERRRSDSTCPGLATERHGQRSQRSTARALVQHDAFHFHAPIFKVSFLILPGCAS